MVNARRLERIYVAPRPVPAKFRMTDMPRTWPKPWRGQCPEPRFRMPPNRMPRRGMLDSMRSPENIETDLMEISSIADDAVKLERIISWCATHPDEVPFALHQLMGRREKQASQIPEP